MGDQRVSRSFVRGLSCSLLWLAAVGCAFGEPAEEPQRPHGVSASRAPDEHFDEALARHLPGVDSKEDGDSQVVLNRRAPIAEVDFSRIAVWDAGRLDAGFAIARDTRFMTSEEDPAFPRRPTFLFPDDGCYARAEAMGTELEEAGYPRPANVFVFGDLRLATTNSPSGSISWWFHVAPLVEAGGQRWVLDPSLEPRHALRLDEWLGMQAQADGELVSVCSSYVTNPDGACDASRPDEPRVLAEDSQRPFLAEEWQRQVDLGRDPAVVLGDHPPWLAP